MAPSVPLCIPMHLHLEPWPHGSRHQWSEAFVHTVPMFCRTCKAMKGHKQCEPPQLPSLCRLLHFM